MSVLVTGHKGYIGSVLTPLLTDTGFDVLGLDCDWFGECRAGPQPPDVAEIDRDFRDLEVHDLKELDAVLHLAGLSDAGLADLDKELTYDINHKATVRLAVLAKQAGVRRFVFSSACLSYAGGGDHLSDEESEVRPVTTYGDAQVRVEADLRELADQSFSPVSLRCAAAYGASPGLRLDLPLNRMVAEASTSGTIVLRSRPDSWLPVAHVEDIARAFVQVLRAPSEAIHDRAFNVGRSIDNHRLGDLARIVTEAVPGSRVVTEDAADGEPSQRVDFTRIEHGLPGWDPQWDARGGVRQLRQTFDDLALEDDALVSSRYSRRAFVRQLITDKRLTSELRWRN